MRSERKASLAGMPSPFSYGMILELCDFPSINRKGTFRRSDDSLERGSLSRQIRLEKRNNS
jgi:hypothetical protein